MIQKWDFFAAEFLPRPNNDVSLDDIKRRVIGHVLGRRGGSGLEHLPRRVILIADDMGYSDIGAFGSEIETPNIDQLARDGMSLTNFHVGATCSPTR